MHACIYATGSLALVAVLGSGIRPLFTPAARLAKGPLGADGHAVVWAAAACEALGGAELVLPLALLVVLTEHKLHAFARVWVILT